MARTLILPTDPAAVKLYSTDVAVEVARKSYFAKMEGREGSMRPITRKTDLEASVGTEVTCYMVPKLNGRPVQGSEKLEGREMALGKHTDKIRVDKFRHGVNIGDIMSQKQVRYSLRDQAKARLSDYIAEMEDELVIMGLAGARGVGGEIQNFPTDWVSFPNEFVAPDANHWVVGASTAAPAKASLTSADKMTTAFIDRMQNRAKRFLGVQTNGAKMQPIEIEGGKHFVLVMGVEQAADLRRESGEAGWLTLQKAAITAEGKANPIFKGSLGMHNNVVLHETETAIKFDDYGAGANVPAERALFLGANAAYKAYGTKDNGGLRYKLSESGVDHDEEAIIHFRMILGVKKARFNNQDLGMQTLDTAYTPVV